MTINWPFATCAICKTQVKYEYRRSYEISGFKFSQLEGSPYVCEKCIGKALGLDAEWRSSVIDFLQKGAE